MSADSRPPEAPSEPARREPAPSAAPAGPSRALLSWLGTAVGRSAATVAIAVAAGITIGLLLLPRTPQPEDAPRPPPATTFLGRPISLDDEAAKKAASRLRRFTSQSFVLKVPGDEPRRYPLSHLGASLDLARLSRLLRDVRDPTSALRQYWERRHGPEDALALPAPVELDARAVADRLLIVKDETDRDPVDARLDLQKRQVVAEVVGRSLDVDATLEIMAQAVTRGDLEATAVYEERRPARLAKELAKVRFDTVLGEFTTPYSRARRHRARTFNLRLAASKLDGTVLLPGETFDFNAIVGPRDEANGYKVAPVIAEGEVVDGIGGGTCQVSGTLHGAAFFAGLEVVERYPHTRPSSYIKMGLDATVVYPTINFRLRNGFPFPVVLHEVVRGGKVTAQILGPPRARTVTLIRRIDQVLPYDQVERQDPNLPEGKRVLAQRGVPGFRLHRYRIIRDGKHAVRERWNDVYPPTQQIVRVGTSSDRDRKLPRGDQHDEYRPDELLIYVQTSRGADGARDLRVDRQPGKTGQAGWTEDAGMPQYRDD